MTGADVTPGPAFRRRLFGPQHEGKTRVVAVDPALIAVDPVPILKSGHRRSDPRAVAAVDRATVVDLR